MKAYPPNYQDILQTSEKNGFNMLSDRLTGSLLRTLAASKPGAQILEIGTGTGLSLCWLANGMDDNAKLISIDSDAEVQSIAMESFSGDGRIEFICADAGPWLQDYRGKAFDLIFADAWPGKYSDTSKALSLLKIGGIYLVDDMLPQANWPPGHIENVRQLRMYLRAQKDFTLTEMDWASGLILAVRTN